MKLFDIFQQLSVGEFEQLAIGNKGSGTILGADQEKLVPHINLGLTAIYKRFNLKEGRVKLVLVPGKTTYLIDARFAQSNEDSPAPVKWLDDSDSPFLDDILKIEKVITDLGYHLPINDEGELYSVHTPSMAKLTVPADIVNNAVGLPSELKTAVLDLVYRANHPKLGGPGTGSDVEELDVEMPDSHLEALLYFVASRVHNPIGMANEFHAGNTYYSKYLAACQELENQNLQVDRSAGNTRAQRNGWV